MKCVRCGKGKGRRRCPALGGLLCPECCGKHRLVEIPCPPTCSWLGGLAIVEGGAGTEVPLTRAGIRSLQDRIDAFLRSGAAREHVEEALFLFEEFEGGDGLDSLPDTVLGWLAEGYALLGMPIDRGERLVDRFARLHARDLSPAEAVALRALRAGHASIYEVTSVDRGIGFRLTDLLDDRTLACRDVSSSAALKAGDHLLGWFLDAGDHLEMVPYVVQVPAFLAGGVVAAWRDAIAEADEQGDWDDLEPRHRRGAELLAAVEALADGLPRGRPELRNREGHALVFAKARYEVRDEARVREALGRLPHVESIEGLEGDEWTWTDPEVPSVASEGLTSVGGLRIEGARLVLECISVERLARLRPVLEEALGGAVRHEVDTFDSVERALEERRRKAAVDGGRPRGGAGPEGGSGVPPEAVREVLRRFARTHLERWVDEPVPALGDRTPRDAARTEDGRREVDRLLRGQEAIYLRAHGEPLADFDAVRRELGLTVAAGAASAAATGFTYDASVAPDPETWLAAGEDERLAAVRAFHASFRGPHPETPSPTAHDAAHVVVENQIAAGSPPAAAATLARLVAAGVPRHDAVHAVGSVVVEELNDMLQDGRPFDYAKTESRLRRLRPEDWR